MVKSIQKRITKKKIYILIAILLAIGLLIFIAINILSKDASPNDVLDISDQTTSNIPSAQSDYNDTSSEENKDPGNTLREGQGTAVVTDNSGSPSSNTNEPKTSTTGEITVYLPYNNAVMRDGQEISGTSSLTTVNFRLIDNVSGVISTGSLKVVNGKFSGTVSYTTSATEGRLDIYGTKDDTTEFSAVEIPVRFNQ